MATALADILQDATNLQSVYLVVMTALQRIQYWNPDPSSPSNVYSTPFPFDGDAYITDISYNGVSLNSGQPLQDNSSDLLFDNDGNELFDNSASVVSAMTPGTFYWDRENLFIQLPDNSDPGKLTSAILVQISYYFSDHIDKIFNDIFYQPLLLQTPGMSLQAQQDFSGVGQIASSNTVFDNSEGFFDSLDTLNWDGGTTTIYLGADNPSLNQYMNFEDYEIIGTWLNDNWITTNQNFTMNNIELKQQLSQNLPQNIYNLTDYPNMSSQDSAIGTPVPWAYGQIWGVAPVCIDVDNMIFQLADPEFMLEGIFSIDDVRAQQSDGSWLSILEDVHQNLATCQFTYPEWDGKQALSVDFRGRTNTDGSWMSNAADMVSDLLAQCGQTQLNTDSFSTSRSNLVIGIGDFEEEVNMLVPSLFLNTAQQPLTTVLQSINQIVGSYLFVDANGFFNYVVFVPKQGTSLPLYDQTSIMDFSKQLPTLQCQSQVTINYAQRIQDKWGETFTAENPIIQYQKNNPTAITAGPQNILLSTLDDAIYWAQRQLIFLGQKPEIFTFNLPWSALLLLPSDQILIQYLYRRNINQVFEIIEIDTGSAASSASSSSGTSSSGSTSYGGTGVELTVSNLHNFNNTTGFWIDDDMILPVQFADLAGYGIGSMLWNNGWDPLIKTWALQNSGYWTNEDGFICDAVTGVPDPVTQGCSVWF